MQGENECSTRRVTLDEAKKAVIGWRQTGLNAGLSDREERIYDGVCALSATSVVGHADIAAALSGMVGVDVPVNRVSVSLQPGDKLVVGQYVGPRLPEGCKILPDGAKIEWYIVSCHKAGYVDKLEGVRADLADAAANFEWPEEGEKLLRAAAKKHFPEYFQEHAFD